MSRATAVGERALAVQPQAVQASRGIRRQGRRRRFVQAYLQINRAAATVQSQTYSIVFADPRTKEIDDSRTLYPGENPDHAFDEADWAMVQWIMGPAFTMWDGDLNSKWVKATVFRTVNGVRIWKLGLYREE